MKILKVIGVRFKKAGKIYFFDPADDSVEKGDYVIVDTPRGLECGEVVLDEREYPEPEENSSCPQISQINRIHRKATKADLLRVEENKINEKKAFDICKKKIAEHGLPMKLINVSYTFDVNKIIFYFTADGRVDFRELVRDLAYVFHTRIELRQVGVRDDAKRLGGIGCCGRPLCCSNFLGDFAPVSIRMAKEQNLSLNPTKISGICGRLLCCLKYESEYYHEKYMENFQSFQPERGDKVMVSEGEGRIVAVNPQNKTATVLLENRRTVIANWDDVLPLEVRENSAAQKNISEETTDTTVAKIEEIVEDEEIASFEEITADENFVTIVGTEEIIAEPIEESKNILVEENFDSEQKQRVGHYNRKANYNKKFRVGRDENFENTSDKRKNRNDTRNYKNKNNRPRKNGDRRK